MRKGRFKSRPPIEFADLVFVRLPDDVDDDGLLLLIVVAGEEHLYDAVVLANALTLVFLAHVNDRARAPRQSWFQQQSTVPLR